MRIKVLAFAASFLLVSNFSAGMPQTPATATSSQQAATIITQSLNAAGGTTAILAITDYRASGKVIHHFSQTEDVQGTVEIKGGDLNHFRMDSTLPKGILSVVSVEGCTFVKGFDGRVQRLCDVLPVGPSSPLLPYLRLPAALNDQRINLIYVGLTTRDGRTVHDIRIQFLRPGQTLTSIIEDSQCREFFIDASTYQIAAVRETFRNGAIRTFSYGDYGTVGGMVVPHSIKVDVSNQPVWTVSLDQITFNVGWQESDFLI